LRFRKNTEDGRSLLRLRVSGGGGSSDSKPAKPADAAASQDTPKGSGEKIRVNTAGKMRFRCFWSVSSSDCRVFTSEPKASPAMASTV
jgi:hypothetical protein